MRSTSALQIGIYPLILLDSKSQTYGNHVSRSVGAERAVDKGSCPTAEESWPVGSVVKRCLDMTECMMAFRRN
jgi:hypothetical protein